MSTTGKQKKKEQESELEYFIMKMLEECTKAAVKEIMKEIYDVFDE